MTPPALDSLTQFLHAYVVPFGWRMLGALALWIAGGWIIRILVHLAHNAMAVRHVDKTLANYAEAAIRVGLRIILVNQAIAEVIEQAGYPVPATHQITHEAG